MLRNILIEGVDCSGKSTLTKELKNRLRWDATALINKPGWQFERYLQQYVTAEHTIFERGHISALVYDQIFERSKHFSDSEVAILDSIVSETMLVILAIPDSATARARYEERKGVMQVIKADELHATNLMFAEYAGRYPNMLLYHSRNWNELERLVSRVEKIIALAPTV